MSFPTQNNKLRCCLHNPKWVFELNFYFPSVRPQAVSEQQAAVIGFPGNLDPSSVFDLRTVSKPAHRQRLLRSKGHLECGILANSYDHRFGELVKVIRVELGDVCAKCNPISLLGKYHIMYGTSLRQPAILPPTISFPCVLRSPVMKR